jgi:hypothetical protein
MDCAVCGEKEAFHRFVEGGEHRAGLCEGCFEAEIGTIADNDMCIRCRGSATYSIEKNGFASPEKRAEDARPDGFEASTAEPVLCEEHFRELTAG